MTDQRIKTLRLLEPSKSVPIAAKTRQWLSKETTKPLLDHATEVRVKEIRDLWELRLSISVRKGHTLEGAPELIMKLSEMNPHTTLRQVSFTSPEEMGNVFFLKWNQKYVGTVFFGTPQKTA